MTAMPIAEDLESIVGLLVVDDHGEPRAIRTAFFSEVAHHPTSLWVSVEKGSRIFERIIESRQFTMAVLHCGQQEGWRFYSHDGFHFVEDALSSTACRVLQEIDLGTHTVFVAEMIEGHVRKGHPKRNLLASDLR